MGELPAQPKRSVQAAIPGRAGGEAEVRFRRVTARSMWITALVASTAASIFTTHASAGRHANPAPITIADSTNAPTRASVYPSAITVAGEGTITDVNVSLNGFSHGLVDDVDVLLVGPGGQSVVLMSDVGGADGVSGVTLTFDDAATRSLPTEDEFRLVSGTYKPTNHGASDPGICPTEANPDSFPAAPVGPYGTTLSVFTGQPANGSWSLFVVDDCDGDAGVISGGWAIVESGSGLAFAHIRLTLCRLCDF